MRSRPVFLLHPKRRPESYCLTLFQEWNFSEDKAPSALSAVTPDVAVSHCSPKCLPEPPGPPTRLTPDPNGNGVLIQAEPVARSWVTSAQGQQH